ncbi:MAG: DUF4347 domain-containing protein, partial [Actinobacteria bacterium]|nr:DUF4347 domain-containing protein [Actinomycetota bacterium]
MFELLEPRLLLSADLNPLATDALFATPSTLPAEFRALTDEGKPSVVTTAAVAPIERSNELVFVDTATPDYESLVEAMRTAAHADGLNVEFVLIDGDKDGIRKITETLAEKKDLDAIHVISHARDGAVQLGSAQLDFATLLKQASQLKAWGNALAQDGDILFYGCDLAASAEGKSLLEALSRLTGADVAASEDLTGAASRGGDWQLEFRTGAIEAQIAVSAEAQGTWDHVLTVPTLVANGAFAQSIGTITPALPAGLQVGDVLLAFFETHQETVTIANANGGTWTEVPNSPQGNGGSGSNSSSRVTVFYSVYNGTQGAPTTNAPGDHVSGVISAFRGVDTSNPINATSGADSTTDLLSIPGATTTVDDVLVVIVATSEDDLDAFGSWANASLTNVTER